MLDHLKTVLQGLAFLFPHFTINNDDAGSTEGGGTWASCYPDLEVFSYPFLPTFTHSWEERPHLNWLKMTALDGAKALQVMCRQLYLTPFLTS